MKLRSILNEDEMFQPIGIQAIDINKTKELIDTHCSQTFNLIKNDNKKLLWRGFGRGKTTDHMRDFAFVDSTQRERVSRNTANFYTLMIDNFPEWSAYPKRSRSLICSNNYGKASIYGEPYLIIPYDDIELAVAPQGDIWGSFEHSLSQTFGVHSLDSFNGLMNEILDLINFKINIYDDLLEFLRLLRTNNKERTVVLTKLKKYDEESGYDEVYFFALEMLKKNNLEILRKVFDPTINKFDLGDYQNMPSGSNVYSKEIWFSGKAIVAKYDSLDELFGKEWHIALRAKGY